MQEFPALPPTLSAASRLPGRFRDYLFPLLMLAAAYALLLLTLANSLSVSEALSRCVLADPKLSRIWSVGNIEIGVAYLGVFASMLFYFLRLYRKSDTHLRDLMYAMLYLAGSFALDMVCVTMFEPFLAMLIGDAIVMTFTVIVSRQLWFQRLLGVFVPIIFLTCGIGHLLEGLSFWRETFHINVPWTMVTADIGFAVLVNSSRFPAFIRGEDVLTELNDEKKRTEQLQAEINARLQAETENLLLLEQLRQAAEQQRRFLREILGSVTEGRLQLCFTPSDLPLPLAAEPSGTVELSAAALRDLRREVDRAAGASFPPERIYEMISAVHEAAMNAVVHAGGGQAQIYFGGSPDFPTLQVWVQDQGKGISVESLPRATLERGFSSAGTLGHGFWLMLQMADRLWLHTSPQGTTIVLEKDRVERENLAFLHS